MLIDLKLACCCLSRRYRLQGYRFQGLLQPETPPLGGWGEPGTFYKTAGFGAGVLAVF
jgi:hypothetical protein